MKLLLDTHIWLWSILEPGRLKPRLAGALDNPENEKWLSPISVWELSILVEKQKVDLNPDLDR
jgi:PIN domain nuclease of toxin-antitoxin system